MSGNGKKAHATRKAGELLVSRVREAQSSFTRAAAVLTEVTTEKVKGEALFWAALGLLRLRESDPDGDALPVAEAIIRAHTRETTPAVEKPEPTPPTSAEGDHE